MDIIQFKQYILEFADRGYKLDANECKPCDWKIWEALFDMVEADGYIEYNTKCYGLFDPVLTSKGELFLLQGGYVGDKRKEIVSEISGFGKDIFKNALSYFITNGIIDILKFK